MTDSISRASATAPNPAAARNDPLAALAHQLRHAAPATLAPLRRIHPLRDGRAALYEAEWLLQAAGIHPSGQRDRGRWELLLHCLAIAQGRDRRGEEFAAGRVLAQLGVSEARVKQLIEADSGVLADLLPRLARRLAAAGASIDWWSLAELLLNADTERESRADAARRRIVRDYLRVSGRVQADSPLQEDV